MAIPSSNSSEKCLIKVENRTKKHHIKKKTRFQSCIIFFENLVEASTPNNTNKRDIFRMNYWSNHNLN